MGEGPIPDQAVRQRIEHDLDTSFLVEAGAGSGKTHSLVSRMLALIRRGRARVDQLAAITFTRKAAAELRQRFQDALERAARRESDPEVRARLHAALQDLDRAFIGTIHAFCSRLLRERAAEAGIDPGFREITAAEERWLQRKAWYEYLERLRLEGSPWLGRLDDLDVTPDQLQGLYAMLAGSPDVTCPVEDRPRPDLRPVRQAVAEFLAMARKRLPPQPAGANGDELQKRLHRVLRVAAMWDLDDDRRLLELLGMLEQEADVTQSRWPSKEEALSARDWFQGFREQVVLPTLQAWREYRYPYLIAFAREAAEAYAQQRRQLGVLNAQDLLMRAARLLREHPQVRAYFARRYTHVLVDEFQDTDPVQAEVILLLTGEPVDEPNWLRVAPRPGSLFVVGDPKQSIYRFRRADIVVYELFKQRIRATGGAVLQLTANFRSLPSIGQWVNRTFRGLLPAVADRYQAAFAPLKTIRRDPGGAGDGPLHGVFRIEVPSQPRHKAADIAAADADRIARWIAWACRGGVTVAEEVQGVIRPRPLRPGDCMILTPTRARVHLYAQALERYGIPYTLSGAKGFRDSEDLQELLRLLRAVADPDHPVYLVGALRGPFFGIADRALYRFAQAGGVFHYLRPQPESVAQDPELAPVLEAMEKLCSYWQWSQELRPAAAVERILADTGLIPLLAAESLGESRAGGLFKALELIRSAPVAGFRRAVEWLEERIEDDDVESGLLRHEPPDAVRVMNLHKAKGLEATVVFLADPAPSRKPHQVTAHVRRDGDASNGSHTAKGYYLVDQPGNRGRGGKVLAHPPDWNRWAEEERKFEAAEQIRLLYVAATRARDVLVVSTYPAKEEGAWSQLAPALMDVPELPLAEVPVQDPIPPLEAKAAAAAFRKAMDAAEAARRRAAEASYAHVAVSDAGAEDGGHGGESDATGATSTAALGALRDAQRIVAPEVHGPAWGRVVHALFQRLARDPDGTDVSLWAPRLLAAEGLPMEWVDHLLRISAAWLDSDLGRRCRASSRRYTEVPVAGVGEAVGGQQPILFTGSIDLIFADEGGWVLVDYKTDRVLPGTEKTLVRRYAPQLRTYAALWSRATGEAVAERWIYLVQTGQALPV